MQQYETDYFGKVGESTSLDGFQVFPNPAVANVTVSWLSGNDIQSGEVIVLNNIGQVVSSEKVQWSGSSFTKIFNTPVQPGLYWFELHAGDAVMRKPVLVQ
jgi:hypothetical protein